MRCDFCKWMEKPENVPSMARHIESFHAEIIPDQKVIWADGELVLAKSVEEDDKLIEVYVKNPKNPSLPAPEDAPSAEEVELVQDLPDVIDLDELPD